MKNRYLPFLSLCIGLLAGTVSCKDDATDDPTAAAIEITTQPIAAPPAGGTLQIAYRIVPAAGGELSPPLPMTPGCTTSTVRKKAS